MLKVAVCDDDELIQVQVEKLVKSMNCLISIKKYSDKSIILDIKEFDIVLMDIEVGNSSGLALAAEARKLLNSILFKETFLSLFKDTLWISLNIYQFIWR